MTHVNSAGQGALSTANQLDIAWGAEEIGAVIGRTPRQTFRMLEAGELPARKINGRWAASRMKLKELFEGEAA